MEDAGCLSMEALVRAVVRMGEDDARTLMGAYVQVLFTLEVLATLGIIDSDRHLGNMHVVDAPDNMTNRTWAYDMGDGTYLCLPPTTHQNLFVMLFDFDDARIVTSPRRRQVWTATRGNSCCLRPLSTCLRPLPLPTGPTAPLHDRDAGLLPHDAQRLPDHG
jgi:hypothetical protein